MFWEEHLKRVVVILKKDSKYAAVTPFRQLPSTTYPETSLPMVGSMVAVVVIPQVKNTSKNVFDLMEAFANHNKDYFKATSLLLEKQLLRCQQI